LINWLVVAVALIDGQAVLDANTTPLTWTIIHQTGVDCVFVLAARLVEPTVKAWLGGTPAA
jgi:hypothetical protein